MGQPPSRDGGATATTPNGGRDRTSDFDLGGWVYLNCAYQGPIPRVAAEALTASYNFV